MSVHKVDGPYSRFSDAVAAKRNNVQAGIPDVNPGGKKTCAVADILVSRKSPFAFVTGYGPDSIVAESSTPRSCRSLSRPQSFTRYCSRSSGSPRDRTSPARNEPATSALWAAHAHQEKEPMNAIQFLLSESTYCRRRAAGCGDPYIAEELRRLAEQFERTARSMDSAVLTKNATMPDKAGV
ncbi:MAG TPA: hypothetical protein VFB29_02355 [Pseudolabrys sp.]|nr:hypothetical protein [Pseudolabrys sp.]